MFLRRDLMPSELEQERIARDEARRINLDSDCLSWGVRDCELIEFKGPTYRPLPPNYRTTTDNPSSNCVPSYGTPIRKNLSLFFANCRSVRNSIDTVTFLLNHRKFDIFALTETWLSDTDSDAFLLSGAGDYFVFRTDRVDSRGGGVLIYAHSTTLPVQVSSLVIPGFECSTIDIFSNVATNATNCIRIITIYRAPNSPLSSTSPFIDYLNLSTSCPHPSILIDASVKPTRNYNFANWDLINRGIAIHDWTIALSNKTATEAYSYFSNFINSLLDAFVPLQTPKTNSGYPKYLGLLHDRLQKFHNIIQIAIQLIP
ncbi:hypothetical protein PENTCL1PPCAC_1134 [Pristionchus entomophagus]|uniref:Endonuclease/exonuclease/phosphatase domain-containing protein n=1 Tax=Pristionchus entomophagus TaxID=358040 RepID=A0AAV5SC94_9BILA|nr:hypothetical protein PENTCL1PPCAC_1134 [Pristionchus entomophagus]